MNGDDLTRWNRAGLSRFRYVDGNAATYLEELRRRLADRFPAWTVVQRDPPADTAQRLDQLLERYEGERGDWGWEIARGLARASHVLTEYLDAYANEGYLGTASQWESVRRLVEMLDYHPAPPASASTLLVLGAAEVGTLEAGFQVKHTPAEGGPPVIFETLEDVEVDPELNELRIWEHDRSLRPVAGSTLVLEGQVEDLEVGEPVVVENERTGRLEARFLRASSVGETTTELTLSGNILRADNLTAGYALVHLKPKDRLAPHGPLAAGSEAIARGLHLQDPPAGLRPGEIAYISDGARSVFRRVTAVDGRRLVLDRNVGQLRVDDAYVAHARYLSVVFVDKRTPSGGGSILAVRTAGDLSTLEGTVAADIKTAGAARDLVEVEVVSAKFNPVDDERPERGGYTTITLSDPQNRLSNPQSLYIRPESRVYEVDSHLIGSGGSPLPLQLETAKPKKLAAGDLVVVTSGRQLAWGRAADVAIDESEDRGVIQLSRWRHRSGAPFFRRESTVYGHFAETARLASWQENPTAVVGSIVPLDVDPLPAALVSGRQLLLERHEEGAVAGSFQTEVSEVFPGRGSGPPRLRVTPPVPADAQLTRSNAVVRGNLARAGHGERQDEKILGSGDATRSNLVFTLEKEVSFVADATQPNGVRADITVQIGRQIWQQVASLRESEPTDPHYTVRLTEEGYSRIGFGDGRTGRRLPSDTNNVRATFRSGSGLAGNLPAGSLVDPARPNRLIDWVAQPQAATGGNDMEAADSMRENAPASVLTLDRAVSLSDFARLAGRQSSVWQARAFELPTGRARHDSIEVVVVPAGGELLDDPNRPLGDLAESLHGFLSARSLPGIELQISPYEPIGFGLDVVVRVKTAEYEPEVVVSEVEAALLEVFQISRRRLGESLYMSEIFEVVEAVEGVESSACTLEGDPGRRMLGASQRQLLYVDPARLAIEAEEFRL